MNTTIQITPRTFGNIAAAAMAHGLDVTTYLVRAAAARRPQQQTAAAPAAPSTDTTKEETAAPAAAPSAGLFNL